jgi:hypothetical protein
MVLDRPAFKHEPHLEITKWIESVRPKKNEEVQKVRRPIDPWWPRVDPPPRESRLACGARRHRHGTTPHGAASSPPQPSKVPPVH